MVLSLIMLTVAHMDVAMAVRYSNACPGVKKSKVQKQRRGAQSETGQTDKNTRTEGLMESKLGTRVF